jgi:hypothetical protein
MAAATSPSFSSSTRERELVKPHPELYAAPLAPCIVVGLRCWKVTRQALTHLACTAEIVRIHGPQAELPSALLNRSPDGMRLSTSPLVTSRPTAISPSVATAYAQGTEVALQLHHSPHPVLYPGPSDRSNMHAQELLRDPSAMQQALVSI